MKQLGILHTPTLLIAVVLAACSPTSSQGPTTWIDRPLDGDLVALEPLTIQAHASDADGVSRFEFSVDNARIATVPGNGARFSDAAAGWMPSVPGTYTIRARAVNGKGNVGPDASARITIGGATPTPVLASPPPAAPQTLTPAPAPLPPVAPSEVQISFTADRTSLKQGECAILQWNVQGPAEVVQLDAQQVDRLGQAQVCPQETTTFTLRAGAGASENLKQSNIVITVASPAQPPTCPGPPVIAFFAANPNTIAAGQSTTLSWGAITNATSAAIDQGVGAAAMAGGTSGSVSPTTTTTFTLTATGCGGTTTLQATVVVNPVQPAQPPPPQPPVCPGPPAIASFTANPSTINAGQSSTLSWGAVTNATSAVIDPDIGGVPTPGSTTVNPGTTRTYTLTASGCGGTARRQVTIVVNPAPPPPPPRDTTPPVVSGVGANPTSLVKEGTGCSRSSRTTTVSATVTDAGGVKRVVARVLGTGIEVGMASSGGNSYQATLGPFNMTGSLSIVVIASDNADNSAQGGPVSIQVSQCLQ